MVGICLVSKPWKQGSLVLQADHMLHDYTAGFLEMGMHLLKSLLLKAHNRCILYLEVQSFIGRKIVGSLPMLPYLCTE